MKIKHVVCESSDGNVHMIYGYTGLNFQRGVRDGVKNWKILGMQSVIEAKGKEDIMHQKRVGVMNPWDISTPGSGRSPRNQGQGAFRKEGKVNRGLKGDHFIQPQKVAAKL